MRLSRVVGIGVLLLAMTGAVAILTGRDDVVDGSAPTVTVRLSTADGQPSALVASPEIVKTDAKWRAQLGEEAYGIVRDAGTEPAFCGGLLNEKKAGIYSCVGCGLPLFSSATKYDSETGWPSFFRPFAEENVARRWEYGAGLPRIESLCARCGAHLGHNFGDGPPPTGRRYCVNSAALVFTPLAALDGAETAKVAQLRTATFAAGCFWHVEEVFRHVPGVLGTQVGYTGGTTREPSYEEVCSHATGHAEAVQLTYDTSQVTYDELLAVFWDNHDPTSGDRQGADVGSQYRSAIFCHSPMQEELAKASKRRLEEAGRYEAPITTQIAPAVGFWRAEEYHQRYLERHDSALCVTMGA